MRWVYLMLALIGTAQAGKLVKFPSSMGQTSDSAVEFKIQPKDRILIGEAREGGMKHAVGDTVQVDATSYLITPGLKRLTLAQLRKDSLLLSLSDEQYQVQARLLTLSDSLDKKWSRIHATDSLAFFKLHSYYSKADSLLGESLALNRRLIQQSYLATGMIGAVGGGLIGAGFEGSQPTSTILYSVGGAALGVAINRFLLKGSP